MACTVDHIAKGRFGWNIVTSGEDAAAQNFGLDRLPEHDLRYEMAEEYMEVVNQLFGSWDPDAVVMDRKTGTYADGAKVRPIDFAGTYYKCRGPLNTAPSPQVRPTYFQAGGSPRGRAFAAKHAGTVIATANGVKAMKQFRDDVRERAASVGRNPDDVKVLFQLTPVLGETEAEAPSSTNVIWLHSDISTRGSATSARLRTSTFRSLISISRCRLLRPMASRRCSRNSRNTAATSR